MKLSEDPSVPVLEGWVNITEAAELLGITRQHGYKMAKNGGFKSLHKVGSQPAYVISTLEIAAILKDREEKAKARAEKISERN